MAFTVAEAISKVREIAAENPNFVYSPPAGAKRCLYIRPADDGGDGEDGDCLVGRALVALGADASVLRAIDCHQPGLIPMVGHGFADTVVPLFAVDTGTPEQHRWLRAVQGYQDRKTPWADAVRRADFQQVAGSVRVAIHPSTWLTPDPFTPTIIDDMTQGANASELVGV